MFAIDGFVVLRTAVRIGLFGALLGASGGAWAADTEPPVPTAQVVPAEVEVGQNVGFVGTAYDGGVEVTNPNLFNWTFAYNGSLVTLHGQTSSYRFYVPGTYQVTLQVDDAAGNRAWTNASVVVREKAATPGPTNTTPPGGSTPGFEALALVTALGVVPLARRRAGVRR